VDRKVMVKLPGGALSITWREDGEIVMTGPATESFRGDFDAAAYGLFAFGTGG
jgi:diaminopimelate epimerase